MNMRRVVVNTPGKMLSYREYSMVRTPAYFDMAERDVTGFKSLLNLHGITDFKIINIPVGEKKTKSKETRTKGLKKNYFRTTKKNTLGLKVR